MSKNNKQYLNTTIPEGLILSLKMLAIEKEVCINALIEEAIEDLLNKYKNKYKRKYFTK